MKLDRIRFGLVSLITISTVSICLKTAFFPNPRQSNSIQVELPSALELSDSTFPSTPLSQTWKTFAQGKRYQSKNVDITVYHLINTDGNVKEFLQVYESMTLNQNPMVRQQENVGFYGLFTYQNRAYLSACINPRGESTFTGTQFARNRNLHDIRVDRVIPWLFTASSLRDQRCLWVQISTSNPSDQAYAELEKVWFELYPTLRDRFSR